MALARLLVPVPVQAPAVAGAVALGGDDNSNTSGGDMMGEFGLVASLGGRHHWTMQSALFHIH